MKKEIQDKWVEALEGDEYLQCKGQLSHPDKKSFCCLGVLTDLYLKESGEKWNKNGILRDHGLLNARVVKWAGLPKNTVFVPSDKSEGLREIGDPVNVIMLNDNWNYSFKQIAKLIRNGVIECI